MSLKKQYILKKEENPRKAWVYIDKRNPLVQWEVARGLMIPVDIGEVKSNFISSFCLSRLKRYNEEHGTGYWELEKNLEKVRRNKFPDKISRLKGIFVFENEQEAKEASERHGFGHFKNKKYYLCEVIYQNKCITSTHDANWITFYNQRKHDFPDNWESLYWEGKAYPESYPLWETLVDNGRLFILDNHLRNEFLNDPNRKISERALLQFSILAGYVGYDLGAIKYFALSENGHNYIKPVIYFPSSETPGFIHIINEVAEQLPEQSSQIDMSQGISIPDLSELRFCSTHNCRYSDCL